MTKLTSHLIIGGDGMIGKALHRHLKDRRETAIATSRQDAATPNLTLDLADDHAVSQFAIPPGVTRVYLLAAITSLKACRENPSQSHRINVKQTARLAQKAREANATPVLVSTNLVFDGSRALRRTDEPPCPTTTYGRQKAEAESLVLAQGGAVIRPGKIMPPFPGPALLTDWQQTLNNGEPVTAFHDLMIAPVALNDVLALLTEVSPGITHLSADHDVSYFQVAQHIAKRIGADPGLVQRASAKQAGIPEVERPLHTTLACGKPCEPWQVIDESLGFDHAD